MDIHQKTELKIKSTRFSIAKRILYKYSTLLYVYSTNGLYNPLNGAWKIISKPLLIIFAWIPQTALKKWPYYLSVSFRKLGVRYNYHKNRNQKGASIKRFPILKPFFFLRTRLFTNSLLNPKDLYLHTGVLPIDSFQKTVSKLLQFLKINNFYAIFPKHLYDFSVFSVYGFSKKPYKIIFVTVFFFQITCESVFEILKKNGIKYFF